MSIILVTGSRGFIGNRLTRFLLEQGFDVKEFDIKISREMDITSLTNVEKIFRRIRPEVVVHLAANANTSLAYRDPYFDFSINVLGTLNILNASKNIGVKHLIFASSAYVYGKPKYLPINEEHPLEPVNPYGLSKLVGEKYIEMYRKLFALEFTIFRFFNIYGPGQIRGFVIPDFIERALSVVKKSENIFLVKSSPNAARDFIYVDDAIQAIVTVIEKGPVGEAFNICSGRPIRIIDIARTILNLLGASNVAIKCEGTDKAKPDVIYGSFEKAKKVIGWQPKTSFEEGIKATINYYCKVKDGSFK